MVRRIFFVLMLCASMILPSLTARADDGTADVAAQIMPPLQLGTRDPALPVWTLLDGGGAFIGYAFQSRDLAPIPGFAGTPVNLLILMDKTGTFLDVKVLSQSEPVFVDGLGPEPLYEFVHQYAGKSLGANIKVGSPTGHDSHLASANTYVDGVSKATASVRIINETILASALQVARERLNGITPKPAARPRQDLFQPMDWPQLQASGLIGHVRMLNRDIRRVFGETVLVADPDQPFMDLWFADLGVPSIGRNLMSDDSLQRIARHVEPFEEAILVMAVGPYSIFGDKFVRNSVPDLLSLRQQSFQVNIRDADIDPITFKPGVPPPDQAMILRVDTRLGFDPGLPWSLALRVVREHSQMFGDLQVHDFGAEYQLPSRLLQYPAAESHAPAWTASWRGHGAEIAALLVFLAGLVAVVRHVRSPRTLKWLRPVMLAFTLGFIGWFCQGQLSIVNVLAIEKAVVGHGDLSFFLYDPFTVLLWLFVLVTLAVWGRGTFCGWLCPFGALQEFAAMAVPLRQIRISLRLNAALLKLKYAVLAAIMGAAVFWPHATDQMVEVEPFKTAITLGFVRHWPFVAYAVLLLGLGMVVFKGFCRYLCPLGAFLSLLSWPRRFNWIARRAECGTPCQLCKVRCRYQAIDQAGRVNYSECFQCLDCVAIHDDPQVCVPLVLKRKQEQRHDAR